MATEIQTVPVKAIPLKAGHDFTSLIGYTRPPINGSPPHMDDLATDNPLYREVRTAKIMDVRGRDEKFNLEQHGFQYFKLPQIPGDGIVDFTNEEDPKIMGVYYAGMADWFAQKPVFRLYRAVVLCADNPT